LTSIANPACLSTSQLIMNYIVRSLSLFPLQISRLTTSLGACLNSKFIFHSQELVLQAYVDFKFLLSKSTPTSNNMAKHTPPCVGNIVDALGLGGILGQLERGWTD